MILKRENILKTPSNKNWGFRPAYDYVIDDSWFLIPKMNV